MKVKFHCSYCESVFYNEDDCLKHEIVKHAQGKAPKFKKGDIVKWDSVGCAYYISGPEYFSNVTNQWIYNLEGISSTVREDNLSLVCKKENARTLYASAIELANILFGDACAEGFQGCIASSVRLDRYFLFTVPIPTDQVLEYMAKKEQSK